MRDLPHGGNVEIARLGMHLTAQQREKRRLARAVGAGETDLPARMQLQARTLGQHAAAAAEGKIAQKDHEEEQSERRRIIARDQR